MELIVPFLAPVPAAIGIVAIAVRFIGDCRPARRRP
jgi:hypothetical protein